LNQPVADALAAELVRAGAGSVQAVLLYGSHLLRTAPDRHSAVDLVVVVDRYATFYRALRAAGELPRPVWLMAALARVLPPNVIAFAPDEGRSGIAKCLIVSPEHLERALGPEPPDHFLLGRLVQKVRVVWTRDGRVASWLGTLLAEARAGVLEWMAPYMEGPFDAEQLGARLLEVCYGGELRPEAGDRAQRIFEAQADHFGAVLAPGLERRAREGALEPVGDVPRYRLAGPIPRHVRARWRRHFRKSKARATARWLKHTITFANWLPYVVRKVERHTGKPVHLTTLERRLPLVFLWPRAIRVLLTRPATRDHR